MDEGDENAAALAVAFVALWYYQCQAQQRHQERVHWHPPYEFIQCSFSLELMPPGHAHIWLQFTPEEIFQLVPLLNLEGIAFHHWYQTDLVTAFCMVCAHLTYPNQWEPLMDLFGRSKSWLSTVFNDTVLYLVDRYCEVLLWCPQLMYERLQLYEAAIHCINGVHGVWGFIDGTFHGYCHPLGNEAQRRVYSGHKKLHGNNYQAIVAPDGLVVSLTGPFPGPVNNWTMFRLSGVETAL